MGVRGVLAQEGSRAEQLVADTRAAGAANVCVGLGVSTGAQAAEVGRFADGVIVGSALVRPLLSDGVPSDSASDDAPSADEWAARLARLATVTHELAAGVRSARTDDAAGGAPEVSGAAL